jgi:hypothetical protein
MSVKKMTDSFGMQAGLQVSEQKKIASLLSYFIFTPSEQPCFVHEGQNREFLRNEAQIHWVKSFKDAYQKLLRSSKEYRQTLTGYSDLEMPFFYIRSTQFVASFRVDSELEGRVSVELRPHEKLANFIKKRNVNLYSIRKIYEDEQVKA